MLLFDGRNDAELDAARGQWKRLKDAGFTLAYWQQDDAGRWEQKMQHRPRSEQPERRLNGSLKLRVDNGSGGQPRRARRAGAGQADPRPAREAVLSASPVLSLIVATKGRASPFGDLFASLETQDFRDFEVVVVDQNADDRVGTPEAEGWSFPVVHLRTPHESGASRGRNAGFAGARGSVILFPDDDCWYDPGFLSDALRRMGELGADVLSGRAADADGRDINGRYLQARTTITRDNVWTAGIEWVVFFRREVFATLGRLRSRRSASAPRHRGNPARRRTSCCARSRPAAAACSTPPSSGTMPNSTSARRPCCARVAPTREASATCCGATATRSRRSPTGSCARRCAASCPRSRAIGRWSPTTAMFWSGASKAGA